MQNGLQAKMILTSLPPVNSGTVGSQTTLGNKKIMGKQLGQRLKGILILLTVFALVLPISVSASLPGDMNGDGGVDLAECITALQLVAGLQLWEITANADTNGDGKIGLADAVYTLNATLLSPPSFSIIWPFPKNTLLGGINYFDHNQTNKFDPWNGYYDSGLAISYFCRENRDQFNVEFFNANGQTYWIRQTYGHHGTDYYLPVGTPILAVADGRVSVRNDDIYERDRVKIYHDNGWGTIYAHSLIRDPNLHNTRVSAGEQIASITDADLEMERASMEIDGTMFWEFHFEMYRPNNNNASGYSAVNPYYGS